MDGNQTLMKPKDAVDAGYAIFRELFPKPTFHRVLLEGLEYLAEDHQWVVKFGFDAGGKKEVRNALGFGPATIEPIREIRTFYINERDGSLVRME